MIALAAHTVLVRRTRWRLALRAALLVTAVLSLLSTLAYTAARDVVYEQLHERLEQAAAEPTPGGPDANRFFYYGGPPAPRDTDGFLIKHDERYGALALLSQTTTAGDVRWLATSAQDSVAALRAFLIALGALSLIGGAVSLPLGYLLAGQALLPLQQAVQARSEFVALASHRLRTPLAVVRTSSELALAGQGLSLDEALRIIQGQAAHMESLAARLGLLARSEAVGADPAAAVDLAAVATEVCGALRPAAELGGVSVQAPGPGPLWVVGTADEVADALVCVVENAIRFTPRGGAAQVSVGVEGRYGVATVTDDGPGIDPADLPRVTRPFVQGRGAREGSGLGLAIARAVAERRGGRLEIRSSPGSGTTVRLLLRRRRSGA